MQIAEARQRETMQMFELHGGTNIGLQHYNARMRMKREGCASYGGHIGKRADCEIPYRGL
jgi:hypothetical protein